MRIKTLMSRKVITVDMDDPIHKVKAIFESANIHHVLVLENTKLFGVISDRDLLKSISPKVDMVAATAQDLATLNKRAHQIMSRNPITLSEGATLQDAISIFNQHSISCIPVINNYNRPIGVVSWRDIMRVFDKPLVKQEQM